MSKTLSKVGGSRGAKSDKRSTKTHRKAGVLKSKLKVKSKQTKAQIEKLNQDLSTITNIHAALLMQAPVQKELNVLDAQSLREGMEKDVNRKLESEKAEKDLASQLELITGMAL
ncbi:hypothetical protein HF325_001969 [Metschnikowia pulcherrima]|uniref:Uncharacterized protein n=1 Tax=Metschnikowia pulcherrima TaxID=27326 RepID=A0A8H7GYB9_9ASCO|nr:hypothetical protein HF325_001969 [Metschnikowia pulcherrima]